MWPNFKALPSEEELEALLDDFLAKNNKLNSFIKIGKTSFNNVTKESGKRYGRFDRYEELSSANVLCICPSEKLALDIEQQARYRSDMADGGLSGDDGNRHFCVYITQHKPKLYECPLKSCSYKSTFDGIISHRTSHVFIKTIMSEKEYAKGMGYNTPAIETDPIPWTYSPPPAILECLFCAKILTNNNELRHHMQFRCPQNVNRKAFDECPICHGSITHGWMPRHLKLHEGKRICSDWKCNLCGHEFLIDYKFAHMKTHDKELAKCPHGCTKMFQKNRLNEHIKNVHVKAKVRCQVEGCTYEGTPGGLRAHKAVHLPPQKCPHCSKLYSSANLKKHVDAVHLKLTKVCPYCSEDILIRSFDYHKKAHIKKGDQMPSTSKPSAPKKRKFDDDDDSSS